MNVERSYFYYTWKIHKISVSSFLQNGDDVYQLLKQQSSQKLREIAMVIYPCSAM